MNETSAQIKKNIKHLKLLSKTYPNIQSVCTEIINLRAILNLPKSTEHFMSDLHGEYEAFTHIMHNCSGVIRQKVDDVFESRLTLKQREELSALIYYPSQKLEIIKKNMDDINEMNEWYEIVLLQLIEVCKEVSNKYTRSKVRKAMPSEYSYILDELLHAETNVANKRLYYKKIMESILSLGNADDFIISLAALIKRLAVDRLHIVGDIFDRGPRPDKIMDQLMEHHSVDFQWGNHDILWMGAAAGNEASIAAVLANSAAYGNLQVLERGYGINLRPLAFFADKTYGKSSRFDLKSLTDEDESNDDKELAAKIYKAMTIIMLKLEGQIYRRRPEYDMRDRLLLDKMDLANRTVEIQGKKHNLCVYDLPTIDPADPYALNDEETQTIKDLKACFMGSQKLQKHVKFLYSSGGMYLIYNQNLLFHGCIPMKEDGSFKSSNVAGKYYSGKALLDKCDAMARKAYFGTGAAKQEALDFMWYLWCGKDSPLFGREKMAAFERIFLDDEALASEKKNPYYDHIKSKEMCEKILQEFGLYMDVSHIINGHMPVQAAKGESPVKGGGKAVVIDGGFCRAYQPKTGIAGYTLIYNSWGMCLSAHEPFESIQQAVMNNADIHSTQDVFESLDQRMLVMDTDTGQELSERVYDLSLLLNAYRMGIIS